MRIKHPSLQELAGTISLILIASVVVTIANIGGVASVVGRQFTSVLVPGDIVDMASVSFGFMLISCFIAYSCYMVIYIVNMSGLYINQSLAAGIGILGVTTGIIGSTLFGAEDIDSTRSALILLYISLSFCLMMAMSQLERGGWRLLGGIFGALIIALVLNIMGGRLSTLVAIEDNSQRVHIVADDRNFVNATLVKLYRHGAIIKSGSEIIYYPTDHIISIRRSYNPNATCRQVFLLLSTCDNKP